MHSLETGVILSVAAFFFFSFLTFTFLRETNISKEILEKYEKERNMYIADNKKNYNPEYIKNILDIIREEGKLDYDE
ncbi:MAG: hypothetical protein IJ593_02540 [Lachnospiraceae bacterium]|nr:hypothetical protein [Lachnospiraceae bacterium]